MLQQNNTNRKQKGKLHVNNTLPAKQPQRRRSCLCSSDNPETVSRCTAARRPPRAGRCWSGQGEQERPRMSRPSRRCWGSLLARAWWALKCHRQPPSWTLWLRTPKQHGEGVLTEGLPAARSPRGPTTSLNFVSCQWTDYRGATQQRSISDSSFLERHWLENWCSAWAIPSLDNIPKCILGVVFSNTTQQEPGGAITVWISDGHGIQGKACLFVQGKSVTHETIETWGIIKID